MVVNKKIEIKKEYKGYGTFSIYPAEQERNTGQDFFVIWLNDKKVLPVGKVIIKEKKKLLIINGNEYKLKVLDTEIFFGEIEAVKWETEINEKDYKLLTEQSLKELVESKQRQINRIWKNVNSDSKQAIIINFWELKEKLRFLELERQVK